MEQLVIAHMSVRNRKWLIVIVGTVVVHKSAPLHLLAQSLLSFVERPFDVLAPIQTSCIPLVLWCEYSQNVSLSSSPHVTKVIDGIDYFCDI
jgi:hypothetical protein